MSEKISPEELTQYLLNQKEESKKFRKEIQNDILPHMAEFLAQIRNLIKDIAIIAGAIAAFTIPALGSEIIQTKVLAQLAIMLLFITIIYAVYHLTEILPTELNGLSDQLKVYMKIIDHEMDGINKSLVEGNVTAYNETKKLIIKELGSLKKAENKPDHTLDYLRLTLSFALVLIFLSLFDYSSIIYSFSELTYNILNIIFN